MRSTGSGMGCPDWPKCFNRYIPPTSEAQLPADYEQKYIDGRAEKNERFAKYLDFFGFPESAAKLRSDTTILEHEPFNPVKTWTEYFNRLAGATAGIFLLLTAVYSFAFIRNKKRIVLCSILNLFLVVFQAWMGSVVVSTNLTPWVITVHMVLALVIVAISIYTYFQARILRESGILLNTGSPGIKIFSAVLVLLTLVQVITGTEVREQVDIISDQLNGMARETWVSQLNYKFIVHRELAILVVVLNLVLFFMIRRRFAKSGMQSQMINAVVLLLAIQAISGLILVYFDFPPYMQTVHLIIGCITFGIQYYLTLLLGKATNYIGH